MVYSKRYNRVQFRAVDDTSYNEMLESKRMMIEENLLTDDGQFDCVREVAWTTFGGVYIKREVFKRLGNFSPYFEWTYNRDVDYCLRARDAGFKIYQIPVRLIHHESRDNKKIRAGDENKLKAEMRNLETLKSKWEDSKLYKTLDEKIND